MRIGYFLSTEEYGPRELIEQARAAEEAGFAGLWISDHFHPWNDEQGNSPFVWSMIGAISQVCSLPVTTAVTCPTVRLHPAVVAQAVATTAAGGTVCSPRLAALLLERVAATAGERPAAAPLTSRERQIAELLEEGLSNKEIAARLAIELPTVKNHVHSILTKLKASRRGQAAAMLREEH